MTIPEFWGPGWTAAVANHLWQSTLVAAVACLLALALRRNQARIRYWVWLSASVKFLIPFSLLTAAGERLGPLLAAPIAASPSGFTLVQQIEQRFPQVEYFETTNSIVGAHPANRLPLLLATVWFCGALLVSARWLRAWLELRAVARDGSRVESGAELPVILTSARIEPGIFGVFRPVLLLPQGMLHRLSRAQLDAIIAHEMCHVRRRDNLTYGLHMVAQALFWFYPAVWWIGARLVEERERACDEAVVQSGGAAEVYAEGILNVCKFCIESPLACAAGVTGSDLKKRIGHIMTGRVLRKLDRRRKVLLGAVAMLTAAAPLALGAMRAMQSGVPAAPQAAQTELPSFEVASIKAHKSQGMQMRVGLRITPDGVSMFGVSLSMLMSQAFGLPESRILNEPGWAGSDRYDIEARVDPSEAPKLEKLTQEQRMEMLVPLLQDRFGLKFHHETKVMEVYALVVDKGGPKLEAANSDENLGGAMANGRPDESGKPGDASPSANAKGNLALGKPDGGGKPGAGGGSGKLPQGAMMMRMSTDEMTVRGVGVTAVQLAEIIARVLGSTVVDKTGLTGKYDCTLSFAPERGRGPMGGMPPPPPPASEGPSSAASSSGDAGSSTPAAAPSIFTAVREQLGLKLQAKKEPVDVIVIDHIQQPSPN